VTVICVVLDHASLTDTTIPLQLRNGNLTFAFLLWWDVGIY